MSWNGYTVRPGSCSFLTHPLWIPRYMLMVVTLAPNNSCPVALLLPKGFGQGLARPLVYPSRHSSERAATPSTAAIHWEPETWGPKKMILTSKNFLQDLWMYTIIFLVLYATIITIQLCSLGNHEKTGSRVYIVVLTNFNFVIGLFWAVLNAASISCLKCCLASMRICSLRQVFRL